MSSERDRFIRVPLSEGELEAADVPPPPAYSRQVLPAPDTETGNMFSVYKAYYPNALVGPQTYRLHYHSDIEIQAMVSGSGTLCCNGEDCYFRPGDVFVLFSNCEHYYKHLLPGDKPITLSVRFDPRLINQSGGELFSSKFLSFFNRKGVSYCKYNHDHPLSAKMIGLLEEMFSECMSKDSCWELFVKAKLFLLLSNLARDSAPLIEVSTPALANKRHLPQMEQSINYILSHLEEHLTLDELAKQACMSRSYYSTIFKQLSGMSVWDFITAHRIDLARIQLENTNNSVVQICESCGFSSIANFNRAFKKITGMTPRDYRKQSDPINRKTKYWSKWSAT